MVCCQSRKFVLLFFLALLSLTLQAQVKIDESNFPDEVFRSYVSSHFDNNRDKLLSNAEILAVKKIDVASTKVADLKGIDIFQQLNYLNCDGTPIASLNLSKNQKLIRVMCGAGPLSSIDLSGCDELREFVCSYSQLEELILSANKALESLVIESNSLLTKLDVSGLSSLIFLDAACNFSIEEINLTGCTELETLYADYGSLTSLDITNCKSLRFLSIYGNQFTQLDIPKDTQLRALNCGGNEITKLALSGCSTIKQLDTNCMFLESVDLSGCSSIQMLGLNNCCLRSLDVSDCSKVRKIEIFSNGFGESGMATLVNSLPVREGGELWARLGDDENVVTTEQVAIAKSKGWRVLYLPPEAETNEWIDYEGSESSSGIMHTIIDECNSPTVYDMKGTRIPSFRRGINIINGKKVLKK